MRIAYLDCFSGISGDMFLGALLDAGIPFELFERTVAALNVGARLERSRVDRGGISATKLDVVVDGQKDLPREEFWHNRGARDQGLGARDQGSVANSRLPHARGKAIGPDTQRQDPPRAASSDPWPLTPSPSPPTPDHSHTPRLSDILKIISAAPLTERAQQLANKIFLALATAEAKVHNTGIEDIHFHEVGAADAIVDIVCAAVGAQELAVDQFIFSPLNVGGGTVTCSHGIVPVPAPATLELLKDAPIYSGEIQKELVTPTGAAIVHVLATSFGSRPTMRTEKIGYGAGTRDLAPHPNVLRISIAETPAPEIATAGIVKEEIAILEANLDDLNPQLIGYIVDRAFAEGALDVFTTPVQMKKSRPGTVLTIFASLENEPRLRALLFRESSTLGVRVRHERRYVLARHHEAVTTRWGEVRMKVAGVNGTISQYAPEYEDCRRIATEYHVALKDVMQEAIRLYLDRQHG